MASIAFKNIGEQKILKKGPSEKLEVVEVIFTDARGREHRTKFALEDWRRVLEIQNGEEIVIDSVSIPSDRVDLVR
jgi:hypothetical protein